MADFNDVIVAAKILSGGTVNVRLVEDSGGIAYPSFFFVQNKLNLSDLVAGAPESVHPAFKVNGVEKDSFEFSLYQNCVINNRALSLPFKDPKHTINFDDAKSMCYNNGNGYHLTTHAEWAAIALWCKNNGFQPRGNNSNGKDTYYPLESGTISAGQTSTYRTYTGSGPVSWNHNNKPFGIADMNGNVTEWCGGWRLVFGEVQVLADNDAADRNADQNASSVSWKAIDSATGNLITPNGSGTTPGSVKLDYSSTLRYSTTIPTPSTTQRSATFKSLTATADISDAALLILKSLAMFPADTDGYLSDIFYAVNGEAERLVYRGGAYGAGSAAGLFYCISNYPRSYSSSTIGFRSAFVSL